VYLKTFYFDNSQTGWFLVGLALMINAESASIPRSSAPHSLVLPLQFCEG
jgi:hypothetical protein